MLALPTYLTANNLPFVHWSLLNTPWVIWLPSVASNAFNILLLKRFFDSIPAELLAAAVDRRRRAAAGAVVGDPADVPADPRAWCRSSPWSTCGRTSSGRCWC